MTNNAPSMMHVSFRPPNVADAVYLHNLVKDSGVLDVNSRYAYLLLCDHFADTCVVAEQNGRVVGFVTAYRQPANPDILFVWQVGVDAAARGQGVGKRMLIDLLRRPACANVRVLETTVGPSNTASRAMFGSVARQMGAGITERRGYSPELFTPAEHEDEVLLHLAPVDVGRLS